MGKFSQFYRRSGFPIGLMLVVLTGGELITGNMMSMSMALYARKISLKHVLHNWYSYFN